MKVLFDPILGRIRADYPVTSMTPPGGGTAVGVIGSGTVNTVTKFSAASTIADSQIWDDGTNVGINITSSLLAKFHVKGGGATLATFTAVYTNSSGLKSLQVRDDGSVYNLGKAEEIENCYFGYGSGIANTSGVNNTGFGYAVLSQTTTQQENTGFGYAVLAGLPASQNCAFGSATMQNATGEKNSAFGFTNMPNVSGNYNCSFGYLSLGVLAAGVRNSGYGSVALVSLTSGSNHTAIGYNALGAVTTVNGCVGVGYEAGLYETAANSLYIHNGLGVTNLATGKTNSLIYGIFATTVAAQRLSINGSVGIAGAATATSTLNISGLPTSSAGLAAGDVWSNSGVLTIV